MGSPLLSEVYICRWPNGDCSFVSATSRDDAIVKLDEIGNAETSEVFRVPDFMLHLNLNDDGSFDVAEFGDRTMPAIDKAYPILCEGEEASADAIKAAVEKERLRLEETEPEVPSTERGRHIKRITDAATVVLDRIKEDVADKILEDFEPDGKPS